MCSPTVRFPSCEFAAPPDIDILPDTALPSNLNSGSLANSRLEPIVSVRFTFVTSFPVTFSLIVNVIVPSSLNV